MQVLSGDDAMAVLLEILVERQHVELGESRDRAEFVELYRRTYAPLVDHCRWRLGAGSDAEDVAQAALMKAWDCWDTYDTSRPFWPWIVTIARRLAIDTYRRSARCDLAESIDQADEMASGSPEDMVALKADAALALAALRQLRPRDQRLIGLRDLEGWGYDELALFEGETVDRVRRHTHRARIALRNSYLRVSQNMAAFLAVGWMAKARRRLSALTARVPGSMAASAPSYDAGAQLLSVLAVLALVLSSTAAPATRARVHSATAAVAAASAPVAATDPGPARPSRPIPVTDRGALAVAGLDPAALPEDAAFESLTPAGDGDTVYAAGSAKGGCGAARCPAIFVSHDAGASWVRLPADGYLDGDLLLPPSFPDDPRIFASSPVALQVSADGGRTFVKVSSVGGFAAMSPAFSSGDPRVLLGDAPGWIYNDADRTVKPLVSVSPGSSLSRTFAFSPSYATDGRLLVGGTTTPVGGADVATVTVCSRENCLPTTTLDHLSGSPQLLASSRYADDGLVFAWRPSGLYRSTDGGFSFSPVSVPSQGIIQTVVQRPGGGFLMAVSARLVSLPLAGGLFTSPDGAAWKRLAAAGDDVGAVTEIGGRLLMAPTAFTGGGVRCSDDGGATWHPRCPNEIEVR